MKAKTIINAVNKFNKELNEYYTATGETELYEVDTTIEGETYPVEFITYWEFKDFIRVELDGTTWKIEDEDSWEMDDFLDTLRYYRRRLRKSWRVWKSENPDAELEKEDEE